MRRSTCALLCIIGLCLSPLAQAQPGSFRELIDLEALCRPDASACLQLSSYDRTGGNDDGFSGQFSFVRKEGSKLILFEEQGPGCIYRIWSANPPEAPIKFFFDGEASPRIQFDKFTDLFVGGKPPFVEPFAKHFLGGWCSYVPIPFEKSCRVEVEGDIRFYQITWRRFPTGTPVKTYGPEWLDEEAPWIEKASEAWKTPGEPPLAWSKKTRQEDVSSILKPGQSLTLFEQDGHGMVRSLAVSLSSDGNAFRRLVLLKAFCDGSGEPSVHSPVGDFFLDGFGDQKTQSMPVGTGKDGAYYSFFPMPFASGIRIELVNESPSDVSVTSQVQWTKMRQPPPYRFHAIWHRENPTIEGKLFDILTGQGEGNWVGVSASMQGTEGHGYLEGDEMIWADGRDNSSYNGTGSEDYYNGGWYFGTTGSAPLYGCGALNATTSRCHAFRFQIPDHVPFQRDVRIGIEHGHGNTVQADYSAVTYWYGPLGFAHGLTVPRADERRVLPFKIVGVTEAEDLPGLSGAIVADLDGSLGLSGGNGVQPQEGSKEISGQISCPEELPLILRCAMPKGPTFGQVELLADGVLAPGVQDLRNPEVLPPQTVSWLIPPSLTASFRVVTWRAHGRIDAASGPLILDYITAEPVGVIEGEHCQAKALTEGDKVEIQGLTGFGQEWSHGEQIWLTAKGPADSFSIDLPVAFDGVYALSCHVTQAGDYGRFSIHRGDQRLGQPIDGYAPTVRRSPRIDLGEVALSPTASDLKIVLEGKNEASSGVLVGIDCFFLKPISAKALNFEAELLTIVNATAGPCSVQSMKGWGKEWSGDNQLWFRPSEPGGAVQLLVPVFEPGRYEILTDLALAPNYGILTLRVDGVPVGSSFDAFVPGDVGKVVKRQTASWGAADLAPGGHILDFTVSGKNADSQGYMVGIDTIRLVRK